MHTTRSALLCTLMLGAAPMTFPATLHAQDAAPRRAPQNAQQRDAAAQVEGADDEILVTGQVERGAVVGDIKPEQQLSPADIRAYGVSSVSELLNELAPQTNAGGGAPVVLLNGKRIAGFQEIQDIPTEAIQRVDILPEQVALSYGYSANQKVVNIVLRQRFRAYAAEIRGGATTEGDRSSRMADGTLLRIRGDNRVNIDLKYSGADKLLESNRNIVSATPDYRTLSPQTSNLALNATLARALGGVSASLNGRVERTTSESLQGLPGADLAILTGNPLSFVTDPLQQRNAGVNGHVGLTLNGDLKPWRWTFTSAYDISDTRTRTDRSADTPPLQSALGTRFTDRAHARTSALSAEMQLGGPLFSLPAGKATSSITFGASTNSFDSSATRRGIPTAVDFSRDIASAQATIDLPLTSRRNGVLPVIGDLGLNVTAGSQQLSDFGTLSTFGYGLRWTPIPQIRFLASMSQDRAAPTGQQVNNPLVVTPNVSVFDYSTGQTVFVTQIGGGIANLRDSDRKLLRVSATVKPFDKKDLTITATFSRARTDNPIASFPSATPQIEAAFPGRFTRVDGQLTQIDARPVNFDSSESSTLRWGFNLSVPIKSHIQKEVEAWRAAGGKREDMPADLAAMREAFARQRQQNQPPPGEGQNSPNPQNGDNQNREGVNPGGPGGEGGGGRGPGGPGGGFGGPGGGGGGFGGGRGGGGGASGRLQFALYHSWHLVERITIAPGVPGLNLLNGDAIGNAGGQPRHELQAQAGYSNNGIGARVSANWQSGTTVNGALGTNSTLRFGSLATADLRLFANVGQMPQLVKAYPFLRGSRVSVSVGNIFNTRQNVRDLTGGTPLRYQPGYLDPLGRSFTVSFRKLFF